MSDFVADSVEMLLSEGGYATAEEMEAGELWGRWELFNLRDAYQDRPPPEYLVAGLLPAPSLSIVYGGPGSLKSMLLADLCVCVAAGAKWLEAMPNDGVTPGITLPTTAVPFLWIDFDNGKALTHERFDALGKAHQLPADHPNIHYTSMQQPWMDASDRAFVDELAKLIKRLKARLIVIDNLGLICGNVEENSGEMAHVMGNLRWLCEETNSAVIVVHHQRKSGGQNDKGIRKGETLRGHSSIEASLDLALLIERKDGEDSVAIIPTKVRRYLEHGIIGAHFTYEHKPGTKDLALARFYSKEVLSAEEREMIALDETIKSEIRKRPGINQSDLVDAVRETLAAFPPGKAPGIVRVRGRIKALVADAEIHESGSGKLRQYYIV